MGGWLILIVTGIYLWVSFSFVLEKNYPMAIVFFAYALANVGFMWVAFKWGQ